MDWRYALRSQQSMSRHSSNWTSGRLNSLQGTTKLCLCDSERAWLPWSLSRPKLATVWVHKASVRSHSLSVSHEPLCIKVVQYSAYSPCLNFLRTRWLTIVVDDPGPASVGRSWGRNIRGHLSSVSLSKSSSFTIRPSLTHNTRVSFMVCGQLSNKKVRKLKVATVNRFYFEGYI